GRDLVITAPSGVKLPRHLTDQLEEAPFHGAVDVLIALLDDKATGGPLLGDLRQALIENPPFLVADETGIAQSFGPDPATGDVGLPEPPVEADGAVELVHQLVGCDIVTATPEFHRSLCHIPWVTSKDS